MSDERGGRGRGPKGDRDRDRDKGKGDGPRRGGGFFRRRRVCKFCAEKIDYINYKDVRLLAPFLPERGKIQPRRISGTCAMHQRKLQTAIKRARQLALIPYVTD
jgi:small subunit ribosomal protein S18